jgi:hypothetical protein
MDPTRPFTVSFVDVADLVYDPALTLTLDCYDLSHLCLLSRPWNLSVIFPSVPLALTWQQPLALALFSA